jgi:hypothetical protein
MIVRIGPVAVGVEAAPAVAEALRNRFAAFLDDGPVDLRLRVETAADFRPEAFHLEEAPLESPPLGAPEGPIELPIGEARASFHPGRGEGEIVGARHLGEVDGLFRLALSIALPARGALLVHAAAVETGGMVTVLAAASGAGKSTAAAALGALSDELVVIHTSGAIEGQGTPWWRGSPRRGRVTSLRCLERGAPSRRVLRGVEALRAVLPHVIRYVAHSPTDRAQLAAAARLCASVPVERLRCPEGSAYLPCLRGALASAA